MQVRKVSYDAEAVIGFLHVLLHKISGKILIIWDGSPFIATTRSKPFSKPEQPNDCISCNLPSYAPDLNPDEGIWQYLKRVELGNVCCTDLDHLYQEVIRARERLRHKRDIIRSCSQQCGYSV